ncbi:hypothetical protein GCM10010277_83150 [Streptomyces longisporoflavus]|nr:hypothetical protein GCM10010277_83150 [Streptomyces longisporoflavus]
MARFQARHPTAKGCLDRYRLQGRACTSIPPERGDGPTIDVEWIEVGHRSPHAAGERRRGFDAWARGQACGTGGSRRLHCPAQAYPDFAWPRTGGRRRVRTVDALAVSGTDTKAL